MNPFAVLNGAASPVTWTIGGLDPSPEDEWKRMRTFLAITPAETAGMLATIEPLFKRGHELVAGTYDYLLQNEETAAILGWEGGADPEHLSERRRFFTVWLARLLGMDFSTDLAHYLFRAGKLHAAHGPRRAHVPPIYVTGSISLVNATFARFLAEEMPGHPAVAPALAGWNKALALHQHLMHLGYQAALALDTGDFPLTFTLFGCMRTITGVQAVTMRLPSGADAQLALRKFFNYYPQARGEVFDVEWQPSEHVDALGTPWFATKAAHAVKPMWRVLLNGKDISYIGGPAVPVVEGDEVHVFPPGR